MAETPAVKTRKPRKRNYLNNRDLLEEVRKSKEQEGMTYKLAHMLQLLCARYGKKGNFANYTYNDDMQAYAMYMLVKTWKTFNADKYDNPFAYYTQCIKRSFIQYLKQERKQRDIRDKVLVTNGLNPSDTYILAHQEAEAARIAGEGGVEELEVDVCITPGYSDGSEDSTST